MSDEWVVSVAADVVESRGSAEWLAKVAESVPAAHLPEFYRYLGAVVRELLTRGRHELAGLVVDALVNLKAER